MTTKPVWYILSVVILAAQVVSGVPQIPLIRPDATLEPPEADVDVVEMVGPPLYQDPTLEPPEADVDVVEMVAPPLYQDPTLKPPEADVDVVEMIGPALVEPTLPLPIAVVSETGIPPSVTEPVEQTTPSDFLLLGSYYLITVPKIFVAGTTETVLVRLFEPEESVDVWATLSLNGEIIAEDSTIVIDEASLSLTIPQIPPDECFSNIATLAVQLRRHSDVSWTVSEERRLTISCNNRATFVQTDKAIYRPGQTVHFRVLTLDQNLIPDLRPVESIWIQAPNKVRVAQWDDVSREENFLVDMSFPMTPDPLLGTWEIHALFQGVVTIQEFVVERYVLPRFEVILSVTPSILVTDEVLPVEVCGIYTYGKPVVGSVEVSLRATDPPAFIAALVPTPETDIDITVEETTDEDGCTSFELDLTPLRIRYRENYFVQIRGLVVTANFVELVSGITVTAESEQISVTTRPRMLTWETESTYKPGLPFYAKFELRFPDGTPSAHTPYEMSCTGGNFTFSDLSETDGEGCANIEVNTLPGSIVSITCRPTFPGFTNEYSFDSDFYTLDPFTLSRYMQAVYSVSFSYLQFRPHPEALLAGEYVYLVLQYTDDTDDGGSFVPEITFQLFSRGNAITADIGVVGNPEPVFTDYGVYYELHVKLLVTSEMSPRVRVVAFFVRDIEVVTAAALFEVGESFNNKVEIRFEEEEVRPGEETNLNINSDPGSLCAVGVVDESVIILGGDNRLTTGKVFDSLDQYLLSNIGGYIDGPPSCIPNNEEPTYDYDYLLPVPLPRPQPVVLNRRKRQLRIERPRPGSLFPQYPDGSKAFVDSGLIYISNLMIETSPCRPQLVLFRAQALAAAAPEAVATADDNVVQESFAEDESGGGPRIVRSYFPETWLWDLHPIGTSGSARVPVTAPDTITDWIGGGFCLNGESGIGVSKQVTLRAFQPFFMDLNLPYSVIRGEEFPISISIFNYLAECLWVEVTMTESQHFDLLDNDPQRVCVCDLAVNVQFYIRPVILGPIPIQVDAVSVTDEDGICGGDMSDQVGARDALQRTLLVEAEGVEEEQTYNVYFCPEDHAQGIFLDNTALLLPENYVPDSASGKITVIGDILGPTLSNLEGLLNIPGGCGEQNMLGLVPNIYVLLYLTSTNQNNAVIENEAKQNILVGYQRELTFRLTDENNIGSYSAFGDSDGEGSAWLTAFVVRSFAQARNFVHIDEADLLVSVQWLRSLQDAESGCFRSSGRVIHKSMQGGVNDQFTLTAYILLAICETGVGIQDETVSKAVECLEKEIDDINDNYAIALVTYALVKIRSSQATRIFEKLEAAAITEEGTVHWESNRADIPNYGDYYYRYHQPAIQVELTAYGLLSYLSYFDLSEAVARSMPIITWLVGQQNPRGGFSSTQDTVVGLQALAEYAVFVFSGGQNIEFSVVASPPCEVYDLRIKDENKLIQQELPLPEIPTFIQIAGTGTGCAIAKVSWKYNVFPEVRNDAPFILNYTVIQFENDESKYHLTICGSYTGDDENSNMALIENKIQSGFAPISESLEGLETKNLKRVEVEKGKVIVYFQELTKGGDCVSYDVEKVLNVRMAKKAVLTVYDYYEKDLVTNVLYYIEEPQEGESSPQRECPMCSESLPASYEDLFCKSEFVYKAFVREKGKLKVVGDERKGRYRLYGTPLYVEVKLPEGCKCDLLDKPNKALLVLDDGPDIHKEGKPTQGYLSLKTSSVVLAWNFQTQRATRRVHEFC